MLIVSNIAVVKDSSVERISEYIKIEFSITTFRISYFQSEMALCISDESTVRMYIFPSSIIDIRAVQTGRVRARFEFLPYEVAIFKVYYYIA